MQSYSFLVLSTADDTIGKVNIDFIPQETLLEMFFADVGEKCYLFNENGEVNTDLRIFVFDESPVPQLRFVEIFDDYGGDFSLGGKLDFRYMPRSVVTADIHGNYLEGELQIAAWPPQLEGMYLHINRYEGSIETHLLPRALKACNLNHNRLTGSVDLAVLPETLVDFYAQGNKLSGSLNLTRLPSVMRALQLSRNTFEGEISLENIPPSLFLLDVSLNRLSGKIHCAKGEFTPNADAFHDASSRDVQQKLKEKSDLYFVARSGREIKIFSNQLSGDISLDTLPSGTAIFDATANEISGSLSLESAPKTLVCLKLMGNKLSGDLTLENLPENLQVLHVSHNRLSGSFILKNPPESLREIKASGNCFAGTAVVPSTSDVFVALSHTNIQAVHDESGKTHKDEEKILNA